MPNMSSIKLSLVFSRYLVTIVTRQSTFTLSFAYPTWKTFFLLLLHDVFCEINFRRVICNI